MIVLLGQPGEGPGQGVFVVCLLIVLLWVFAYPSEMLPDPSTSDGSWDGPGSISEGFSLGSLCSSAGMQTSFYHLT